MDKILASFQLAHPTASKNQIKKRILDIADKERHPAGHGSQRWIVKEEAKSKAGIVLPDAAYTPKRGKKAGPGSTPSSASSSSSSAASASATAVATAGSSSSRVLTVAAAIANMSSPSSRLRSATSSAASASKSLPIASPLLPRPPSASSTPSSLKKLAGKSSPKVSISKDGDVVDAVEAGDKFAVSSGIDGEAVATRDGTAGSATSPARKIPFTTPLPPVSSSSSSSSSTSSSSNSSSSSSRSSSSSGVPKKVTTSLLNFFNKPSDKASKKSEKKEKTEEEEVKDKEKEDKEKKEKEEREKKEKEEREKNYLVINLEDSCSGIGHTVTAAAGAAVGTGTGTGPVEGQ